MNQMLEDGSGEEEEWFNDVGVCKYVVLPKKHTYVCRIYFRKRLPGQSRRLFPCSVVRGNDARGIWKDNKRNMRLSFGTAEPHRGNRWNSPECVHLLSLGHVISLDAKNYHWN